MGEDVQEENNYGYCDDDDGDYAYDEYDCGELYHDSRKRLTTTTIFRNTTTMDTTLVTMTLIVDLGMNRTVTKEEGRRLREIKLRSNTN